MLINLTQARRYCYYGHIGNGADNKKGRNEMERNETNNTATKMTAQETAVFLLENKKWNTMYAKNSPRIIELAKEEAHEMYVDARAKDFDAFKDAAAAEAFCEAVSKAYTALVNETTTVTWSELYKKLSTARRRNFETSQATGNRLPKDTKIYVSVGCLELAVSKTQARKLCLRKFVTEATIGERKSNDGFDAVWLTVNEATGVSQRNADYR